MCRIDVRLCCWWQVERLQQSSPSHDGFRLVGGENQVLLCRLAPSAALMLSLSSKGERKDSFWSDGNDFLASSSSSSFVWAPVCAGHIVSPSALFCLRWPPPVLTNELQSRSLVVGKEMGRLLLFLPQTATPVEMKEKKTTFVNIFPAAGTCLCVSDWQMIRSTEPGYTLFVYIYFCTSPFASFAIRYGRQGSWGRIDRWIGAHFVSCCFPTEMSPRI